MLLQFGAMRGSRRGRGRLGAALALVLAASLGLGNLASAQNAPTTGPNARAPLSAIERAELAEATDREALRLRQRPTGGLRAGPQESQPGARYFTASQLSAEDEAALRRFSIDPVALTTGGIAPAAVRDEEEAEQELERRRAAETDAYAALGIRAGPLTWFPAIDLAVGYDSNPDSLTNARAVRTVRLSPELRVQSDWSRHAWNAQALGSLAYVDDDRDLAASLDLSSDVRLDLGLDTALTLRGGYALTGEAISDPNAPAGADGTTSTHVLRAGAALTQRVGPVEVTGGLELSRFLFSDTPLAGGASASNSDRDRHDFLARLRLESAEGPILRPFVEGSLTLRRFDERIDRSGFARDSLGYGLRGGLLMADGGPLRGEASLGVVGESFEDDRLESVMALSAQAGLTWDITQLTSARLDVETSLTPTTQAGAGVGIARSLSLGFTHQARRNFELRLGAGVSETSFSGIDADRRTYSSRLGATWRLSPVIAVRLDGTFEHELDAAGDINRATLEAGVTLRR